MTSLFSARRLALSAAVACALMLSNAYAWDPPDGPSADQAYAPNPPTALVRQAHGYIIQNGISILYNDGYWFAADFLRGWQQELLNGVRYADVKDGYQKIVFRQCELFGLFCQDLYTWKQWPLAADNHYYNPDSGQGLTMQALAGLAAAAQIPAAIEQAVDLGVYYITPGEVVPSIGDGFYPSALAMFSSTGGGGTYPNAVNAYTGRPAVSVGGRQGVQLAMFYLGWSSHFLQDLTVVHHTFDEPGSRHSDYEAKADGLITSPPVANGQRMGVYSENLGPINCTQGSSSCFLTTAAYISHDEARLNAIANNDDSSVGNAIDAAQDLQAGLYAKFLTDVGQTPVHMSAVIVPSNIVTVL